MVIFLKSLKKINIIPLTMLELILVLIFVFTYGSTDTSEIILMWVSVILTVAIWIFDLIKHGIKDGLLASLAETVFSIAVAFLVIATILSVPDKKKKRK